MVQRSFSKTKNVARYIVSLFPVRFNNLLFLHNFDEKLENFTVLGDIYIVKIIGNCESHVLNHPAACGRHPSKEGNKIKNS